MEPAGFTFWEVVVYAATFLTLIVWAEIKGH